VFETFTEHAREAIVGGQHEARDMGHGAVQVEHLLLGLFLAEDDIVSRVWADLALTIQPVRDMVRERLGVGPGSRPEGLLPFSPTAKDALRSAHRLGMGKPGTEHMLLVLLARGAVSEILTALGADSDEQKSVRDRDLVGATPAE
jgi:ATP-dependent Clp protease ATP-binding subunit ClpC